MDYKKLKSEVERIIDEQFNSLIDGEIDTTKVRLEMLLKLWQEERGKVNTYEL